MSVAGPEDSLAIATHIQNCLHGFQDVQSTLTASEPYRRSKIPPGTVQDAFGRFRLWVGNIGAHRRGRASLDYKLREASHIRSRVIELLQSLTSIQREALEIIAGDRVPWEDLSDSDSDESENRSGASDDELPSELAQLTSNMAEVNICLMRLSLAIRNPAPHDQFKLSTRIDVSHFETFDIDHVRGKFPSAPGYLVLRLGRAISRRRQYLRYREDHRKRLEQGLEHYALAEGRAMARTIVAPSEKIESTVASSMPPAIKSSALVLNLDEDDCFEDTLSQTSYASSNNDPTRSRPPALPKNGQDGEPFECPLCCRLTSVRQTNAWHKHVYRDLQPYLCTFEDCKVPDRTYESRHEWFQHELQAHREWWECIMGCDTTCHSLEQFREHLLHGHTELADATRIEDIVRTCQRQESMDTGAKCPLCQSILSSLVQLRRHLGKHHEELSLFALPSHVNEDENEDGTDDTDHQSSPSIAGSYADPLQPEVNFGCLRCDLSVGRGIEDGAEIMRLHHNGVHAQLYPDDLIHNIVVYGPPELMFPRPAMICFPNTVVIINQDTGDQWAVARQDMTASTSTGSYMEIEARSVSRQPGQEKIDSALIVRWTTRGSEEATSMERTFASFTSKIEKTTRGPSRSGLSPFHQQSASHKLHQEYSVKVCSLPDGGEAQLDHLVPANLRIHNGVVNIRILSYDMNAVDSALVFSHGYRWLIREDKIFLSGLGDLDLIHICIIPQVAGQYGEILAIIQEHMSPVRSSHDDSLAASGSGMRELQVSPPKHIEWDKSDAETGTQDPVVEKQAKLGRSASIDFVDVSAQPVKDGLNEQEVLRRSSDGFEGLVEARRRILPGDYQDGPGGSPTKWHRCPHCAMIFEQFSSLKTHLDIHQKEQNGSGVIRQDRRDGGKSSQMWPSCQRCRDTQQVCDRQRPCKTCEDAGITMEECISDSATPTARPSLSVQIPASRTDLRERSSISIPDTNDPPNVARHPKPSRSDESGNRAHLSPTADSLLSLGEKSPADPFARPSSANSPPNPFSRSSPPANRNPDGSHSDIDTPISALPSRFLEDGILPSPSSFYPEWSFGHGDTNVLPSPLTFHTPVIPSGPSFGYDESLERKRKLSDDESVDSW
jgi:uncharacterized C2H2 Zn-finger protein